MRDFIVFLDLGSAPPGTGSPGPFGPGTPEESEKTPERVPRAGPQSPRPGVSKESESQVLDSFRTLFGLRGALFGDSGGAVRGTLSGLSSDSSRVPGPKGSGDPVPGGADLILDIFEIFAEDWFLLRSLRKFLPSGFLPLSRFEWGVWKSLGGDLESSLVGKASAIYRIEKPRNPENRRKIGFFYSVDGRGFCNSLVQITEFLGNLAICERGCVMIRTFFPSVQLVPRWQDRPSLLFTRCVVKHSCAFKPCDLPKLPQTQKLPNH